MSRMAKHESVAKGLLGELVEAETGNLFEASPRPECRKDYRLCVLAPLVGVTVWNGGVDRHAAEARIAWGAKRLKKADLRRMKGRQRHP